MQFTKYDIFLFAFISAIVCLSGCGKSDLQQLGPLVPVKGKVTLAGKPLRHGTVHFYPQDGAKNHICDGFIDAEGNYSLTTAQKPGVPVGKYRATVEPGSHDIKENLAVPPQYASSAKSSLLVTVTESPPAGAYDLKLQKLK